MESVYEILKDAIYQPTREKVNCRVIDWRNNGCTFYVSYINNQIVGILVVEKSENALIIKSIGVLQDYRKSGIGRELVNYLKEKENMSIYADTDDDAVEFYKRCGFDCKVHYEVYGNNEVKRYKCVL